MITLLIVDDSLVVRQMLQSLLSREPDIYVVDAVDNAMSGIRVVQQWAPDVIVMDVQMPQMDGITATAVLRELMPESAVIIFSSENDKMTQRRAELAGARAFVAKSGHLNALVSTIRLVASSERVVAAG